MKERPIIFDAKSVKAILAGNKTQTRRVVKHPTINHVTRVHSYKGNTEFDLIMGDESGTVIACPYGYPGDRLWVRETWGFTASVSTDGHEQWMREQNTTYLIYRATETKQRARWRSSIHMPRWASRITLEVATVRVQRLQEISDEDCEAEIGGKAFPSDDSARFLFLKRWDDINAKRGYPLAANPWVWVVEFKVL